MTEVVDLLPRDAELARRAAGGDGAAFVRLYDAYSSEVFTTSLAVTGSVAAAAEATQKAFIRLLRWPPRFGATDEDVSELLFALALGGRTPAPDPAAIAATSPVADVSTVGWLRSETVATAGARFDSDWSEHLWHPHAEPEPAAEPEAQPKVSVKRQRRRLRMPRLLTPAPAATAAVVIAVFVGAAGTMLAGGATEPMEAAPSAAPSPPERAELRAAGKHRRHGWGTTKLLRDKTLEPLLAP